MLAHALRPRAVTELLDAAFHLYRAHFVPLVTLAAIMLLPFVAFGIFAFVVLLPMMPTATTPPAEVDLTPFLWIYAIMPFALLWFAITDAGLQIAASDAYLRGEAAAGRALREAFRRGWRIIGATLLKYLVLFALVIVGSIVVGIATAISAVIGVPVGVGFLAAVPYAYGRLALVPSTCVLEDSNASRAIERSIRLSDEHGWRIVGGLFLVYLVLVVLQFTVAIGLTVVQLPLMGQVLGQLVWIVGYPIVAVLTMLFYYDLRIRKEGFDLEVMSASLAATPEPSTLSRP